MSKILVIDTETSGMSYEKDVTRNHQIVSIGLIVSDSDTFAEHDTLYLELKWNGTNRWDTIAESIHGLSKEYLNSNGVDEEDAVAEIVAFIMSYFDVDEPIMLLGHNSRPFDLPFLEKLLGKFDFSFKFSHRTVDSFSIGLVCFNT